MSAETKTHRIPGGERINWFVASFLADFLTGYFGMLLAGSLGFHWGYWHSWWVVFLATSVFGMALWPLIVRIEYLIEHR